MTSLHGKVAVVTGGSRGIGRAIVESFLNAGAAVATCGRGARPAGLADSVGWVSVDVASSEQVKALKAHVEETHGPATILVNNAAFATAADADKAKQDALARHATGRFGEPDDIAKAALWLASDEAAFVTGQCITVDGGLTAASPLQPGLF